MFVLCLYLMESLLDVMSYKDFHISCQPYKLQFQQVVCLKLTDPNREGKELLQHLFGGLSVYFNYTGESKCLNADEQADVRLDDRGWDFQVSFFVL